MPTTYAPRLPTRTCKSIDSNTGKYLATVTEQLNDCCIPIEPFWSSTLCGSCRTVINCQCLKSINLSSIATGIDYCAEFLVYRYFYFTGTTTFYHDSPTPCEREGCTSSKDVNPNESMQRTLRFEVDNYVVAKINQLCIESLESSTIRFVSVVAAKCLPNFCGPLYYAKSLRSVIKPTPHEFN